MVMIGGYISCLNKHVFRLEGCGGDIGSPFHPFHLLINVIKTPFVGQSKFYPSMFILNMC